jgi:hypothetical protein
LLRLSHNPTHHEGENEGGNPPHFGFLILDFSFWNQKPKSGIRSWLVITSPSASFSADLFPSIQNCFVAFPYPYASPLTPI